MNELIKILLIVLIGIWMTGLFFSWLLRKLYKCWMCNQHGARKVIAHYSVSPFGALVYYKYRCKSCGAESFNFVNPLGQIKSIETARSETIWKEVEIEFGHMK